MMLRTEMLLQEAALAAALIGLCCSSGSPARVAPEAACAGLECVAIGCDVASKPPPKWMYGLVQDTVEVKTSGLRVAGVANAEPRPGEDVESKRDRAYLFALADAESKVRDYLGVQVEKRVALWASETKVGGGDQARRTAQRKLEVLRETRGAALVRGLQPVDAWEDGKCRIYRLFRISPTHLEESVSLPPIAGEAGWYALLAP